MSAGVPAAIRVLMLNYEYPPVGGGAGNATRYLIDAIVGSGRARVDLVTSNADRNDSVYEPAAGLRIHSLAVGKRSLHYWTHREIITYFVRALSYTRRLMNSTEFDCCHAMFGFPAGLIAKVVCRGRCPYIVSLRGSDVPGFNRRFALHYHVLRPVLRRVWRSAAFTVANSTGLRELALETDPDATIEIVPNGIDLDEFSPAIGPSAGPMRLICVSRLIPRKAIDVLIKSFVAVHARFPQSELTIVGDGTLDRHLRRLAQDLGLGCAVRFAGYQPHEAMAEFYRSADLFVLPSRFEGMSNALLEAMSSGLPVVVTDTGGVTELVEDNGIVVQRSDPDELASAILTLLDDDDRRRHAGAASRKIAEEFGWRSVAHSYLDMYRTAAEKVPATDRETVSAAVR